MEPTKSKYMSDTGEQSHKQNIDHAIRVQNIIKSFGPSISLGKPDAKSLNQVLSTVLGRQAFHVGDKNVFTTGHADHTLFEDFSLDIERKKITCLMGASGAGKTILLKLMSGVQPINAGRIEIHGSVVSLLKLGENMEPNRTIRENVELFARLFAIPQSKISNLYDGVIEFSELGNYDDIPIRTFSTGMQMRLSVAMVLLSGAEILLIDDVLAVGDLAFQEKCVDQLWKLKAAGTTAVLVMQDEILLNEIADRIIRLAQGKIISDERVGLCEQKTEWRAHTERFKWHISSFDAENDFIKVLSMNPAIVEHDDRADICLTYSCKGKKSQTLIPLIDIRHENTLLMRTIHNKSIVINIENIGTKITFSVELPIFMFCTGTYFIDLGFLSEENGNSHSLKTRGMLTLEVASTNPNSEEKLVKTGLLNPDFEWSISKIQTPEAKGASNE